ncbi:MAG: hypothetical protein ACRD1X_14790 [Vicinamibacteria bacterium]
MNRRGDPSRRHDGRRQELVELLTLVIIGLWMASFFSPALPRLDLPLGRWTGVLSIALAVVVFHSAYRARGRLHDASRWTLAFFAILLLQSVTRIPFLLHPQASLNSDRAVTLIMIENILDGTSRPIYFYGQLYQGSLDTYVYSLVAWVARPEVAVLLANVALLSVFVVCGVLLSCRIASSRSWFYPIVVASLPVGAMLFVSMDRVHGFASVACLLGILLYLVFRAAAGEGERFLWMGFVAGLLLWSYQPSLTWIASLFCWLLLALIGTRRWAVLGKATWQTTLGLFVGALPHVLSEINNGLVNTRSFFLAPERPSHLVLPGIADVAAALAAILRLDPTGAAGETVWYGVVSLSLWGVLVSLHRAVTRREAKWIYLPAIFGLSLGLLLVSGFPPTERYLVHYRLYGLFLVVLAGLACMESAFFNRRKVKSVVLAAVALLTIGISIAAHRRLAGPDAEERATIEKLKNARETILVGDYWNTLRFAPFLSSDRLITAAPSVRYPNAVFDGSKYYPLALELGERWDREARGLLSRHSERRRIERLLQGLGVGFSSEALDGFVIYSGFSGGLSAELAALLIEGAEMERDIRAGSYRALEGRLAVLSPPAIEERSITAPAPVGRDVPPEEALRIGWRYVLLGEETRITIPADPVESRRYVLPPAVGLARGTYQAHLYYLGRPVHDYGRLEVTGVNGGLVISELRDEASFLISDADEPRRVVSGLPLNGTIFKVQDGAIRTIELRVYSFFDFGSSIWTNRYQQVLLVDEREIPLHYRENTIMLPAAGGTTLRLDTRYKTLLTAKDSIGSPAFHNVGAVLERVTVHLADSAYDVVPFLQNR